MLLEKKFLDSLIDLLNKIPIDESKETVLNTMLTFVEGFYDALKECRKEKHNLKPTLEFLISRYTEDFKVSEVAILLLCICRLFEKKKNFTFIFII